jgi:hypothetical protein
MAHRDGRIVSIMTAKEYRRGNRVPCAGPVRVTWDDDRGQTHYALGKCLDISENGLRVELQESIPVRTRVAFRIERIDESGSGSVRHATRRNMKVVLGISLSHPLTKQILESLKRNDL